MPFSFPDFPGQHLPETERRTSKEFFIFAKVISRDEDMTKRIQLTAPNQIQATIQLPSSKSICNRALIIRALAQSHAPIENLSDCDDTRVMVKALQENVKKALVCYLDYVVEREK